MMPAFPLRSALALILAAGATACSSLPSGFGNPQLDAIADRVFAERTSITREQVEARPFASIGLRADDSAQLLLILGTVERNRLVWISGDRVAIATVNGRIVQTVGTAEDLGGLSFEGTDPVARAIETGRPVPWMGAVTLPRFGSAPVALACETGVDAPEPITILDVPYDTIRVVEHCEAPGIRWRFRNTFWVRPADGAVLKSRQAIAPFAPIYEIETMRPYAPS